MKVRLACYSIWVYLISEKYFNMCNEVEAQ